MKIQMYALCEESNEFHMYILRRIFRVRPNNVAAILTEWVWRPSVLANTLSASFLTKFMNKLLCPSPLPGCVDDSTVRQYHLHVECVFSHCTVADSICTRGTSGTHTAQTGIGTWICYKNSTIQWFKTVYSIHPMGGLPSG